MTSVTPIPTTRVADLHVRTRLTTQLQRDQAAMFRLQEQVSTGRRISMPSDDPAAALRAIQLQSLLERKDQVQTNLTTNVSFLDATDATLNQLSGVLADIRGSILSVAGTTATETQRLAVVEEIDGAIQQFLNASNQSFRGRHLFGGTHTGSAPYAPEEGYIRYDGNEQYLRSYADVDVLFNANLHGVEVFGGISQEVRSEVDLNPHIRSDTLLADLHGGQGVTPGGAVTISDGNSISVVDLSSAATLSDVAKLIEAQPPEGREIRVEIGEQGLLVTLDSAGGGNLTITEVGGGTTARELGILEKLGAATGPVVGDDLNPRLLPTTRLNDLLGSKAATLISPSGANNDFHLQAALNGATFDGTTVHYVDDDLLQAAPGVSVGTEFAEFDAAPRAARGSLALSGAGNDLIISATTPGTDFNNVRVEIANAGDVKNLPTASYTDVAGVRTLSLGIDDTGETTVGDLVAAIDATGLFTAIPDDSAGESYNATAAVLPIDVGVKFGNTGITGSDGNTLFIHIDPGKSRGKDVVAAINGEGTFTAQLDPRDSTSTTFAGLGSVDVGILGVVEGGSGEILDRSGIRIELGESTYDISFEDLETVEDLLNAINHSGAAVAASINEAGNGIDIRSRLSGADFSIGENGGNSATQLGIRTLHGDVYLGNLNRGFGVPTATGSDFQITTNDGAVLDVDVSSATSVQDVLDLINNHPLNNTGTTAVVARLAEFGNGIQLVDDNATGAGTLQVTRVGQSHAAEYLGLIPIGEDVSLPAGGDVATGELTSANLNTALSIEAASVGTQFNGVTVDLVSTGGVTGNAAVATYDSLTQTLTIDIDPLATQAVTVQDAINAEGTFAAALSLASGPNDGSGLVAVGDQTTLAGGSAEVLAGRDVHPQETLSVFNSLIRVRNALENGDLESLERGTALIDDDMTRLNFARAENGARTQGLDVLAARLDEEEISLRSALSEQIDVDITEAISNLTSRQIAFEASLRIAAGMMRLSVLDFI